MRLDKLLAEQILELIDAQTHKLLGAIQDGRVVLGGSAGSAGGVGDPPAGFWGQLRQANVTYDTAGSRPCASGSAGSDSLVDNLDAIRLGWEICDDAINEDHIDWGFGAGQVSAVDVPFATTSGSIDATNVRDAIEETYAECYGNGGNGLGDHDHSASGSGGSILDSHMVTGNLILDDGVGDSPELQFVGGANDDTARLFLDDSPVAGRGRLIVRIPSDQTQSALEVQDPAETILISVSGIGNVRIPDGQFEALHDGTPPVGYFSLATAETNTVQEIWGLRHATSQTPLAGFGGQLLFELYNAVSSSEDAAALDAVWDDPADGSEDSRLAFKIRIGGAALAEMCRIDGTGLVMAAGRFVDLQGGADALVLDADGDTTISAPVDDWMDFETGGADRMTLMNAGLAMSAGARINEFSSDGTLAGDSDTALPTEKAVKTYVDTKEATSFVAKNTSGGAASAGDIGYIDAAGEYKTTATAYNDVEWCVVLIGGANNADIYVARRGRVTVILNGNCSAGDYLYTSTTAGQAQPSSTSRWEMFGVALTANAAGAGGTCEALLLCHRKMTPYFNTNYLFQLSAAADDSDWSTTIAALPGGAVVTYTVPLGAGAENAIDVSGAGLLGKLVLHNTTRSDSAFISTVNIGANQITLTAAVPGGWIVGDTITVRSQTNVQAFGAARFFDVYMGGSFDATTVGLLVSDYFIDFNAANILHGIHTYEGYNAAKFISVRNSVAGLPIYRNMFMGIVDQRITIMWNANGINTASASLQMVAVVKAAP